MRDAGRRQTVNRHWEGEQSLHVRKGNRGGLESCKLVANKGELRL